MAVSTNLNGSVPAAQAGTIDSNGVRLGVFEDTFVAPNGSRKTVLTFVNQPIVLADNAGVIAFGSKQVYDFPDGLISFEGAVSKFTVTKTSTGVIATWAGKVGLGTTAADNTNALATTEQDLIPTTTTPAATASVGTADALSTSTEAPKLFDGSATGKDMFLNVLVNDTDHDVTTTPCNLIYNGTLTFHWRLLGDV